MGNFIHYHMKISFVVILLFAAVVCSGQQANFAGHTMHGTVRTPDGKAIVGLQIKFLDQGKPGRWAATDVNGDFALEFAKAGDYVVHPEPESLYPFRAFIKIVENGPNPDNVVFTIDPTKACCTLPNGTPFPKLLSSPKPAYPPAARAVRGSGDVIVDVIIGPDGKVNSAKAQAGHPLLRAAAVAGAKSALFEPAEVAEREARLFYVFLMNDKPRDGVTPYTNPYRTQIISVGGLDF